MPNNIYDANFDERKAKFSYWYIENRVMLRRISIVFLAGFSGIFLFYGLWGLANHYLVNYDANKRVEYSISEGRLNYEMIAESSRPKGLQTVGSFMMSSDRGNFDFAAEVFNPNSEWLVESFDYYFNFGGERTETKSEYILPRQRKFLMDLNYPATIMYSTVNVVIDNVKWKKVANYTELREKILQFDFKNVRVLTPKQSGVSGKLQISTIEFDILNQGSHNFWDPKFVILIYQGSRIININQLVLSSISSGEILEQSLNIFQKLPINAKVEIVPDINILNEEVFKGYDFNSGELK